MCQERRTVYNCILGLVHTYMGILGNRVLRQKQCPGEHISIGLEILSHHTAENAYNIFSHTGHVHASVNRRKMVNQSPG